MTDPTNPPPGTPTDEAVAGRKHTAGALNANRRAGIALAVVVAVFLPWARLKPIVVPETTPDATEPPHKG